jgi:hypothetical protein
MCKHNSSKVHWGNGGKSKAPLKLALYKGEWLASCLTKTAHNTPWINTVRTPEVVQCGGEDKFLTLLEAHSCHPAVSNQYIN